jgi:hypothetical protein
MVTIPMILNRSVEIRSRAKAIHLVTVVVSSSSSNREADRSSNLAVKDSTFQADSANSL